MEPLKSTDRLGRGLTVTVPVAFDIHPVDVLVKLNVAVPAVMPVTKPLLVTVAIAELELDQVPPVVGDNVVVLPVQTWLAPVMETVGLALTVTAEDVLETQPVAELVNLKVAVPAATPVISPTLEMVATDEFELVQVPPLAGVIVAVPPTHIAVCDGLEIVGKALTVKVTVLLISVQMTLR